MTFMYELQPVFPRDVRKLTSVKAFKNSPITDRQTDRHNWILSRRFAGSQWYTPKSIMMNIFIHQEEPIATKNKL